MISRQIAIVEPYENPNLDNPNLDNPNLSNQGTSQIVNIPVDYPIPTNVPNIPVNVPNIPVNLGSNNLVDVEIQPIKTPTASTTTSPTASTTTSPIASTTTSPTGSKKAKSNKNMQYLIYGGGALAVIIVYKLLFSNKEN